MIGPLARVGSVFGQQRIGFFFFFFLTGEKRENQGGKSKYFIFQPQTPIE